MGRILITGIAAIIFVLPVYSREDSNKPDNKTDSKLPLAQHSEEQRIAAALASLRKISEEEASREEEWEVRHKQQAVEREKRFKVLLEKI